jgi:hypothetical protein
MRAAVQSQRGGDLESSSPGEDAPWESGRASPSRQHTSASLCFDGPIEKYGCITPRTKSARLRNTRKSYQHFSNLRTATLGCVAVHRPMGKGLSMSPFILWKKIILKPGSRNHTWHGCSLPPGYSHVNAHPDNLELHTGAVCPHPGFVESCFFITLPTGHGSWKVLEMLQAFR